MEILSFDIVYDNSGRAPRLLDEESVKAKTRTKTGRPLSFAAGVGRASRCAARCAIGLAQPSGISNQAMAGAVTNKPVATRALTLRVSSRLPCVRDGNREFRVGLIRAGGVSGDPNDLFRAGVIDDGHERHVVLVVDVDELLDQLRGGAPVFPSNVCTGMPRSLGVWSGSTLRRYLWSGRSLTSSLSDRSRRCQSWSVAPWMVPAAVVDQELENSFLCSHPVISLSTAGTPIITTTYDVASS
jgi:hypothetical protein